MKSVKHDFHLLYRLLSVIFGGFEVYFDAALPFAQMVTRRQSPLTLRIWE